MNVWYAAAFSGMAREALALCAEAERIVLIGRALGVNEDAARAFVEDELEQVRTVPHRTSREALDRARHRVLAAALTSG